MFNIHTGWAYINVHKCRMYTHAQGPNLHERVKYTFLQNSNTYLCVLGLEELFSVPFSLAIGPIFNVDVYISTL